MFWYYVLQNFDNFQWWPDLAATLARKKFWDRSGDNIIILKSINYFCKNLYLPWWPNSEYASNISFLKSTLEYVHVYMRINVYIYMHISVTTFAKSFVLNVWLVSKYVPQISFFKFRFRICSRVYVSSCYGLKTATFKMELYVTIVNGFYILNAAYHLLQYLSVSYFYRTFLHFFLVVFCRIVT